MSHLEEGYLTNFFQKKLPNFRLSMAAGIFFVGTWAYVDFTFYPDRVAPFLAIKFGVMLAFALGLLFSLTPYFEKWLQLLGGGYVLLVGAAFCVMIVMEASENIFPLVFGITIDHIFNYSFVRLRFITTAVTGWTLFGLSFLSLYLIRSEVPIKIVTGILYYLAILNLLGMIISYAMERSSRREYLLSSELTAERDKQTALSLRLQESLDEIKTLRGILPIRSNCKKVRNDDGYWQRVEVYLLEHTHAEITHGLCSECVTKLYPEFVKEEES